MLRLQNAVHMSSRTSTHCNLRSPGRRNYIQSIYFEIIPKQYSGQKLPTKTINMYLLVSRQLRALAVPRIVSCLNLDQRTFEYKLVCLMLHTQIHLCIRNKSKTFISKHVHRQQYTTQKIAFNVFILVRLAIRRLQVRLPPRTRKYSLI